MHKSCMKCGALVLGPEEAFESHEPVCYCPYPMPITNHLKLIPPQDVRPMQISDFGTALIMNRLVAAEKKIKELEQILAV